MDISRELIGLKRRALEHQVKENKPTLRMVFFDEVKDSIEVIPPYETPINFEELRNDEHGMKKAMKKIANDEYAMSILIEKKPDDWKD